MEFVPPKRVFQQPPQDARIRHEQGSYDLPDFLFPTQTNSGGMASVFKGHPFPRKGFIVGEAVFATAKVKRVTLAMFKPFTDVKRGLLAFLESYLYNYNRMADMLYADCVRIPYLHYEYYSEFSKATWDFVRIFLTELGINKDIASKTGLICATIFENDDAYRIRPQDILSESSKEALIANPRKEIKRLLDIYKTRELCWEGDENHQGHAGARIVKMVKMFSLLLWLPPVKRAFKKALSEVRFEWFQYDTWDYYWCLNRGDYNCLGRILEDRMKEQIEMMTKFAEQQNPGKRIEQVKNEDGTININVI